MAGSRARPAHVLEPGDQQGHVLPRLGDGHQPLLVESARGEDATPITLQVQHVSWDAQWKPYRSTGVHRGATVGSFAWNWLLSVGVQAGPRVYREVMADEEDKKHSGKSGSGVGGSPVYGLGVIGAWVYFWKQSDTPRDRALGLLKGTAWPAFLVYGAFSALAAKDPSATVGDVAKDR